MTYQEQLDKVRAAINAVLEHGQTFSHDSGGHRRQITRADLADLEAREKRLIPLVAREKVGGITVRYGVPH